MFGLMTPLDGEKLTECLLEGVRCAVQRPVRVLEIGVRDGATARGMREIVVSHNAKFFYVGVDNNRDLGLTPEPFPGAVMVIGDSGDLRTVDSVQGLCASFDLVLVDGCHCRTHVEADATLYRTLVRMGGYLLFHDAAPGMQGKDFQGHGDLANPDDYVAVRSALAGDGVDMLPPQAGWSLDPERYDNPDWGGMLVYRRVSA